MNNLTEKKCCKCKETKYLSDFYKDKNRKDGRQRYCKTCKAEYQQSEIGKASLRKSVKKYSQSEHGKAVIHKREKAYYQTDHGKKVRVKKTDRMRKKYPLKHKARNAVWFAVQSGKLTRPTTCSNCNTAHPRIEAHHDDYAQPLLVRWFCPPCHREWHRQNGEAKNAA